jgi:hypothetical protein
MRVGWDGTILGANWAEALAAAAAVLTPFAILGLTLLVDQRSRRLQEQQQQHQERLEEQQRQSQQRLEEERWRNQELVKARLDRYNQLAIPLNSIFCYFTFVGGWKEISPVEVVDLKRQADQAFYVAMPLFTEKVKESYEEFMGLCFEHFGPWGEPAKLRTGFCRRRKHYPGAWDDKWTSMFDREEWKGVTSKELTAISEAHNQFLRALAVDVGVDPQQVSQVTARVELNKHECPAKEAVVSEPPPPMTDVREQLRRRLAHQVAGAYRRWVHPTSGRRPGDRFP